MRKAPLFLHYLQVVHLHVPLTEPTRGNLIKNLNPPTLHTEAKPDTLIQIPKCNNHTAYSILALTRALAFTAPSAATIKASQ